VTHDQLATWVSYLFGALVVVLILGLARFGGRIVDRLVQRLVPKRFVLASRALFVIFAFFFFVFIMILAFTVFGVIFGLVNPK